MVVFDPDTIAEQVGAVESAIDVEGDAEFAWTVREIVVRMPMTALAHQFDAFYWLERADEDRVWNVGYVTDDVELVVHAVNKIDVGHAAFAIHRLGSVGPSAAVSM